jgi:hypothetical protein
MSPSNVVKSLNYYFFKQRNLLIVHLLIYLIIMQRLSIIDWCY